MTYSLATNGYICLGGPIGIGAQITPARVTVTAERVATAHVQLPSQSYSAAQRQQPEPTPPKPIVRVTKR